MAIEGKEKEQTSKWNRWVLEKKTEVVCQVKVIKVFHCWWLHSHTIMTVSGLT